MHTKHLLAHKLYFCLAIIWTFLIFYLCLHEAPNVPKFSFQHKDKIVHFIFYFFFVYFWTNSIKYKSIKAVLIIVFLAFFLGIFIEFLQENITTNRKFDWLDILANFLGAISGIIFLKKFYISKN